MKRIFFFFSLMLFILTAQRAFADDRPFDAGIISHNPPAEGSPEFKLDVYYYEEGKKLRTTERGKQAVVDAEPQAVGIHFSKTLGFAISKEKNPALFKLIDYIDTRSAKEAADVLQLKYMRIRPFVYFNEHTCFESYEKELLKYPSYPSGHTIWAYTVALVLSELFPDRLPELINRAYEIGRSRVICGCHWQSDIEEARIIATAFVAYLHTQSEFKKLLRAAGEELAKN